MVEMDMVDMDVVDMDMVDIDMVDMEMVDMDMVDQRNVTQCNLFRSWIRWTTGHGHSGPRKQSISMVHYWVRHAKCTWSSLERCQIARDFCSPLHFSDDRVPSSKDLLQSRPPHLPPL